MNIGGVIRQYRKSRNLTQEEMASRLGVSAPAVNKWENGKTLPDVALLAPIARLLGITVDELLSFQEALTEDEIVRFVRQIDTDLDNKAFADVFAAVKGKIEEYPNCTQLIWQTAIVLHAKLPLLDVPNAEPFRKTIVSWVERCLQSEDERIRRSAAEALFYTHINAEDYEKASRCTTFFAVEDPKRRTMEALLKSKTGAREEAYRAYEEIVLDAYQNLQFALNDLRMLYMEDNNREMTDKLVDVSSRMAAVFEMGRYNEVSVGLDVAVWEKNVPRTAQVVKDIFESLDTIGDFAKSPLYRHMKLETAETEYIERLRKELLGIFTDESFAFMDCNAEWEALKRQVNEFEQRKG